MGEAATFGLSKSLRDAGFTLGRLKTGTPPRLDRKSINFDVLEAQEGDDPPMPFSYLNDRVQVEQQLQRPPHKHHAHLHPPPRTTSTTSLPVNAVPLSVDVGHPASHAA